MPRLRSRVACSLMYSPEDLKRMQRGVIPEQMEDKWFVFWERNTLHFHRSWTGFCCFRAKFRQLKSGWKLYEIVANRNAVQYRSSDEHDLIEVPFLIDLLLLHKQSVWPEDAPPQAAVELWHDVGRAFIGQHPNDGTKD